MEAALEVALRKPPSKSAWNDERIAKLRELVGEGISCAEIAIELGGGITRNGVIGKIHRLGMAKPRVVAPRVKRKRANNLAFIQSHKRAMLKAEKKPVLRNLGINGVEVINVALKDQDNSTAADLAIPKAQRKRLRELEAHHCRWPIGDPTEPEFFFCGADKEDGLPYCYGHARMAYRAAGAPNGYVRPESSENGRATGLRVIPTEWA